MPGGLGSYLFGENERSRAFDLSAQNVLGQNDRFFFFFVGPKFAFIFLL